MIHEMIDMTKETIMAYDSMASDLTPYDTGEVCEAHPWIPYGTPVTDTTPAENFGKVDLDDEEGATVCTIRMTRRRDGRYVLAVEPLVDTTDIVVEITDQLVAK